MLSKMTPWCAFLGLIFLIDRTFGSIVVVPKDENMELLILHNNDMHARFEQTSQISSTCDKDDEKRNKCYGGFARVADRVKDARRKALDGVGPPVLYLNAGDTYTGTVWFTLYKWKIAADFVNMLRPDAVSLGNHEFDNGISGLSPFIRNLSCPVLCANIELDKEPEIKAEHNLKKSIVIEVNGRRVGVIGYLTPDTKFLVSPNNVEYIDEVVAIQKEVDELLKQGVNILIALGHSGFETDKRIAKEVKGIDLVIGGHSNTFLWNGAAVDIELPEGPYPTVIQQDSGKKVPVVQAFAYTKYLGKLHLFIDKYGEIDKFDGQPILLDGSVNRDPDVVKLLEEYRPNVTSYIETVVGRTRVLLDGATASCRARECNMGNLIADAMIFLYTSTHEPTSDSWSNAPIAIMQGGGIRTSIDVGDISRADIMSVLPFENKIVTANVSGKVLNDVLEWSVYNYKEVSGAFLQVSGIQVVYNLSKSAGQRVVSAHVRCGKCLVPQYSDISDDETYQILMTDFLLKGGDRYKVLVENGYLVEELGKTDTEMLENYIRLKSPVYTEVQGRITVYGEDISSAAVARANVLLIFVLGLHYFLNNLFL